MVLTRMILIMCAYLFTERTQAPFPKGMMKKTKTILVIIIKDRFSRLERLSGLGSHVIYIATLYSMCLSTVEPRLNGHPWPGNGRWTLNRGWSTLNIFHHRVDWLLSTESHHDSHDKRMFECFYHSSPT